MIEKHVTSLQYSQRLKGLGFNRKSLFYWIYDEKNESWDIWFTDVHPDEEAPYNYIPAYLATELLEWLEAKENILSPSLMDIDKFLDDKTSKCDSLAKIVIHILEEIKK